MNRHKIRPVLALLILLGLLAGGVWPVAAQQVPLPPNPSVPPDAFKAGEVLVRFRTGISIASAGIVMEPYDAMYVQTLYGSETELWHVPEGSELATVESLNANPQVEYAEPNYRVYAFDTVPNDPSFDKQWAHATMRSPAAWDITTGKRSVTIAILDTGIDEAHPDLVGKILPGYDYIDNDSNPHDLNGHGTHVAGIAAAVTNNGVGVAGMNWKSRLLPVRVLDAGGVGYAAQLASGIRWAKNSGAKVLSISLGGPNSSSDVQAAVNEAHAAGSLVIAAMGNENSNELMYPAAYDNVLAVAATGQNDLKAPYSSFGTHCDVAAPGGNMSFYHDPKGIYSTMPTYPVHMTTSENYYTNYDYVQGTSQAAPYVAGLAALLWALEPSLTPDQAQATIQTTAVDKGVPGWDQYYGHGRVDALAAVRVYSPPVPPVLSPINNADGDGTYLVNWNDVPYATSYVLEEDDDPAFTSPIVRYTGANSQYQVTGQTGGNWYYRVRASNVYGDSPWSNQAWVTVVPGPPTLLAIGNPGNGDAYQVAWSAPSGAAGYTLQEDDNSSFSSPTVRYKGTWLQYNVTGQPGGTWYYRVRAHNAAGDGAWSITRTTTVNPPALQPPNLSEIDNVDGDGQYLVDWTNVTGANSYVLEQSRDPYFSAPMEVYSGTESQFQVLDQPGGTWLYRVRAFGAGGRSPWSATKSAAVTTYVHFPLIAKRYSLRGVENGDFEAGPVAWTQFSSKGYDLILKSGFPSSVSPHGGDWAVWLGGAHKETAYIAQQITVPLTKPYLHYWHWIDSEDYCGFDLASVRVDGVAVKTYNLCTTQNTGGWVAYTVNLGAYIGTSVSLQIRVQTDDSLFSNLYVDDVSFEVSPLAAELAVPHFYDPDASGFETGRRAPFEGER